MMKKHTIEISGMTCENCEKRVYDALSKVKNIYNLEVSYKNNTASFECDEVYKTTGITDVEEALKEAGYGIKNRALSVLKMIGILFLFFGVFMFLNMKFGSLIPKEYENLSFVLVFAIGFFTSIHCIAMCGGIVISTCLASSNNEKSKAYMPSLLYNLGRLTSYTLIGGVIGAIGSVFKMSYGLQNILLLIVSVLMIITGLNMLGIKAFRKFASFSPLKKLSLKLSHIKSKSPYIIGLLNGFMPCGPLQAMQLYALASGSFIMGALNMFFFSLGTIPLMFGIGFASTFARGNLKGKLSYVSAMLVMVLGITMLYQVVIGGGMLERTNNGRFIDASTTEQVQEVITTLENGVYQPITVVAGKKVRWIVRARKDEINFCNNSFNSKPLGIKVKLKPGDNIIEFTPTVAGVYQYQCWMNMIKSTITVLPANSVVDNSINDIEEENLLAPLLANRSEIAVAKIKEIKVGSSLSKVQEINTTLSDGTYKPIVVQKGLPVKWVIDVDKYDLNFCNNAFNSRELGINTKLKVGQNIVEFTPREIGLYEYNCWMNMISSNIEVVDNLENIDINSLAIASIIPTSSDSAMSCGSGGG